jgi:hypothetical protein
MTLVGRVLAVLNDNIQAPITIQNGRNEHTLNTYAFTIGIVPLILEVICYLNTSVKPRKRHNLESVMQNA